jgi:peptidoglycan hydrolase-like protein with peptidoglycan-binding domain
MGRITILATALAAIVGSAGVGWYAGSQIKSPAQVAAEAEPPAPSLITVSVEMRTLSSDVITRGDVRYDEPVELELDDPPSTVGGTAIVTRAPHEGGTIDEGEILLEVSGRPIIVLRGELPMYRTMRPGDQGDDVRQLEEALARLDLEPGAVDGVFDDATERAIGDLYGRHGFLPPGPTEQEAAELQAAIEAVAAAKLEVSAARRELGNASQGPSQASILSAEAEARNAERMLEDTESRCAIDEDAAAASVEAAEDTLARATADLTRAETRLTEALGGIHPDTGLPPTAEELDALEADVRSARTGVESAHEALAEAERQESLVRRSCESAIAGAEDQVAIANALLQEARRPPDTSSARGYLSDSKQRLTAARELLASV